ncbi:MAG: putative LPS assembly protein LptD [Bacteroidota bacterium]
MNGQKLSQFIDCTHWFCNLNLYLSQKISTKSRLGALHSNRHFFITFLLFLLLGSTAIYAQDPPTKGSIKIEAKTDTVVSRETDTLLTKEITFSERVNDTIKEDSILPQQEGILTDIVEYYGEDYVYIDRKNGKIYMYNKAFIIYEDYRIDAGLIILDYNKNEVYAKGIDSTGIYSQTPVFVQASNKIEPDSIKFNFDTKKAIIYNAVTEQTGIFTRSEVTKKVNDSVYFLRNVKFTTSTNIEDPEYYFYTRKAKFVPKSKIVTGLTNMYIADVPTPLGLPFAFFPLTEDRASGFIIPTIGEQNNRGFFFQNGGYYFAINDHLDLTLLGDYYTNGSYALRMDSDYAWRYKFKGNVSVRFENLINSERGFSDFSETRQYNIRWSHNQDAKANPTSQFRASVNLGSSRFLQRSINQVNNGSQLVNQLSSSISYAKTFNTQPEVNITVAATHQQNTQTEVINMSLPNLNANVARIFPFAPKNGAKKGVFQNINLQYTLAGENRIETNDDEFFKSEMFDNAQYGARHTIPISTNFKVLNYLSVTAGTNFQETWVGQTIRRDFDDNLNEGQGGVVEDTISGFDAYRTYGFNASLGTTVYGDYVFHNQEGKIKAIRHTMRPTVSYSINPGFDQFYDEYRVPVTADPNVDEEMIVQYSRFENTLFGAPGRTFSSSMSFGISNSVEAKVRDRDTTATEAKKISLLNNLNFNSGYRFSADSLKLNPIAVSAGIPIIEKLDLNLNGELDPYALDNNNQKIDVWNIDNGGSLFRLTRANISFNYSFSSRDFEGDDEEEDEFDNETFRNGGRPDDLFGESIDVSEQNLNNTKRKKDLKERSWYQYDIPWDLRLAYTITYSNNIRQNEISSHSVMFSSNVELSPRWSVGVSSGYDFRNKGVSLTQFRFVRDLESWTMRFNWTPIGARNTAWNFFIGITGNILQDIKYDKRREADRRL